MRDETIDRIRHAVDLSQIKVRRSWAGLRTFSPDKAPIVGFDPSSRGFFWLAGQGGYGIKTSPALAQIAKTLVTENQWPASAAKVGLTEGDLSPLRFRRASIE